MAYTVRQFISECDNYQYSQEYFDILKESMEIDLMERYIKNQEFLIKSGIDTSVYTENYFMEADDKSVEDVKGKVNEKKKNLIIRLINWIIERGKRFINFLRSGFSKIFKHNQNNKGIDIEKEMKELDEALERIRNDRREYANQILGELFKDIDDYIKNNIKYLKFSKYDIINCHQEFKRTFPNIYSAISYTTIDNSQIIVAYMKAAIFNAEVKIYKFNLPKENVFSYMNKIDDILEMYNRILDLIQHKEIDWFSVSDIKNDIILTTTKNGLFLVYDPVDYNENYINNTLSKIENAQEEIFNIINSDNQKYSYISDNERDKASVINDLNDILTNLNIAYSHLTKIYVEYFNLKTEGIKWANRLKTINDNYDSSKIN